MIREAAWLDAELSRVVGRARPATPLAVSANTWQSRIASSSSANMNTTGAGSPYGYNSNVQGGPALTNEDVRRLEHPNEFQ